jgi:hypothetical protein
LGRYATASIGNLKLLSLITNKYQASCVHTQYSQVEQSLAGLTCICIEWKFGRNFDQTSICQVEVWSKFRYIRKLKLQPKLPPSSGSFMFKMQCESPGKTTNFDQTSTKLRVKLQLKLQPNFDQNSTKLRPNFNQTSAKLQPNFDQTSTKLQPNFNQLRSKFGRNFD